MGVTSGGAGLRAAVVLLACCAAALQARRADAQFVGIDFESPARLVFGATQLAEALLDQAVSRVVIHGTITLSPERWTAPSGTVIFSNRRVMIEGDGDVPAVLNFGQMTSALLVGNSSSLGFANMTLRNSASRHITKPDWQTRYQIQGLGCWPSVIVQPGASILFNNTLTYYYSEDSWQNCTFFQDTVSFQLAQAGLAQDVQRIGTDTLLLAGAHWLQQPIFDLESSTQQSVGMANVTSANARILCVPDPFAGAGGLPSAGAAPGSVQPLRLKWWSALIIGLGASLFLLLVGFFVLWLWWQRWSVRLTHEEADVLGSMKESSPADSGDVRMPMSRGVSGALSDRLEPRANGNGRAERWAASGRTASGAALSSTVSRGPRSGLVQAASSRSIAEMGSVLRDRAQDRARDLFSSVEVGPLLGRGSYGKVYKGRWQGALVAIKVVEHAAETERNLALRESTLATSIQHPNVVTTYRICNVASGDPRNPLRTAASADGGASPGWENDAGTAVDEERPVPMETWLLLEYCDRSHLGAAIAKGKFRRRADGAADMVAILRSLLEIASGMAYLHSLGVLHGDLKVENVLLKSQGGDARLFTCKLGDFGMSRLLEGNATHLSTQTYGTVAYQPAELLRDGKLSPAADGAGAVYSFAILMYELYVGHPAYEGFISSQVMFMVCVGNARPDLPHGMSPAFLQLLTECWAIDPAARPSFEAILPRLRAMLQAELSVYSAKAVL
ncbi:hypothetical protein WJX81_001964 [Elliptochloris bilobata]|uniref:Protein kinase domain-containing protein n=1 Tax=Elliptochloris bilobata TaxID=381761 RepID=A0AAW1QMN9_9CHLO